MATGCCMKPRIAPRVSRFFAPDLVGGSRGECPGPRRRYGDWLLHEAENRSEDLSLLRSRHRVGQEKVDVMQLRHELDSRVTRALKLALQLLEVVVRTE